MNNSTDDLLALKKDVNEALEANRNLRKKIVQQKTDNVFQNRVAILSRWSTYRKLWTK